MPTALQQLKRASFGGVAFPVTTVRISGGIRDHVHEYPHSPGGATEKLGRKLYEISMSAPFLQGLVDPKWANLWPQGLATLRRLWEAQETEDLHIPTIGTIRAHAVDWTQEMNARVQNGEMVEVKFREDQAQAFLIESLVTVSPASIQGKLADFELVANDFADQSSIFSAISELGNSILAFGDQVQLAGNLLESKIRGLTALIQQADQQLDFFNDPRNYRALDALHELWLASVKLHEDVQSKAAQIRTYTVPITTPISEISRAIFGDTLHAAEILQLNAIEDPFAIPAGTQLRFYDAA